MNKQGLIYYNYSSGLSSYITEHLALLEAARAPCKRHAGIGLANRAPATTRWDTVPAVSYTRMQSSHGIWQLA